MGITFKNWNDLLKLPIDVVTMGNHTWAKKRYISVYKSSKAN